MATPTLAHQAAIANLYIALFNRAPDAAGFAFWTQALADGASIDVLARGFVQTPEAQAIYPASQTAAQFVTTYYTNVLGRAIDESGLKFWTEVLESSGGVNSNLARALVVSKIVDVVNTPLPVKPDGLTDAAYALTFADRNAFKNKVDISIFYATDYKGTDLNLAKQVLSVVGPATTTIDAAKALLNPPTSGGGGTPAPVVDPDLEFTGTDQEDNFVGKGGNDTFKFVIDNVANINTTLTSKDVVTGGPGKDTLTVTTTGDIASTDFTLASISGIETVNIKRTDASALAYNAGAGVETVSVENGTGSISINGLADGSTLSLKNTSGNVSPVYQGGVVTSTLALAGSVNAGTIIYTASSTSLTVTSDGSANVVDRLLTGPRVTSVKIAADAALSFNYLQASSNGTTVNVSGKATVGVGVLSDGSIRVIDASENTGGLTATLDTHNQVVNIKGSSGNDVISTSNAVLTTISDRVGAVDAGAGTGDRLIVNNSVALNSAALGERYTNFEILRVENGVTVDLDHISGITSVEIADGNLATGVTNLSADQAAAVSILSADGNGALSIGVKGATTINQIDTVKASVITTAGGSAPQVNLTGLTLTGVEKLELTGNGAGFSNDGLLSLTTTNATSLDSIVIKNAGVAFVTVDAGHTAAGLSIDASGAAGETRIDASAYTVAGGVTIKGGAGGGTLTGSAKADTIIGGAGNDLIIADRVNNIPGAGEVQTIGLNAGVNGNGFTYTLGNYTMNLTNGMSAADVVAAINVGGANYDAFMAANPTIASLSYSVGAGQITINFKSSAGDVPLITSSTTATSMTAFPTGVTTSPPGASTAPPPVGDGSFDTLTGGAGNDTFRFYSRDNNTEHSNVTAVITDFKTGEDKIDLTVSGPQALAAYSEVSTDAGSVSALLTSASTALNNTVTVYVGRVGTDTYVVSDLNGNGYTDVIKLTGIADDGVLGVAYSDFVVRVPFG